MMGIVSKPIRGLIRHWQLVLMLLPLFAAFIIFNYAPLTWLVIAFKNYNIGKGIWDSPWVGLKYFKMIFSYPDLTRLIRNTVFLSLLNLVIAFPISILFAMLMNEIRHSRFKKVVQTVTYLPYFIPWTILSGFILLMFSIDGLINGLLVQMGFTAQNFLTSNHSFIELVVGSNVWKNTGWNSIVFMAAIAGINPEMYEAAIIDRASRFQRAIYITIPSIMPVIGIMFILQVGSLMSANLDQLYNMYNPLVYNVADVIDTYVVRQGITQAQYSITTAMGLFKGVVGLILILSTNYIVRKSSDSENSLW